MGDKWGKSNIFLPNSKLNFAENLTLEEEGLIAHLMTMEYGDGLGFNSILKKIKLNFLN